MGLRMSVVSPGGQKNQQDPPPHWGLNSGAGSIMSHFPAPPSFHLSLSDGNF